MNQYLNRKNIFSSDPKFKIYMDKNEIDRLYKRIRRLLKEVNNPLKR